ncbi:MAG: hypothetical protein NWQ19_09395, partial [Nonlabens sp.]|nr:hypothetical protein [Nonlabens sp.]
MDNDALIQRLITGTATPQDQELAAQLTHTDPAFNAAYNEAQDLRAALIKDKSASLKALFNAQETAQNSTPQATKSGVLKYLLPVLAAAAIISFIVLYNSGTGSNELYDTYYEPYRNVMSTTERGAIVEEDLVSRAFYNYDARNYAIAIQQLDSLYNQDPQAIYLFYKANALQGAGDLKQAIALYKKHQQQQDDFYARSRWYLALAYLKDNNLNEAQIILKEIVALKSYNYKNAGLLLQEL